MKKGQNGLSINTIIMILLILAGLAAVLFINILMKGEGTSIITRLFGK